MVVKAETCGHAGRRGRETLAERENAPDGAHTKLDWGSFLKEQGGNPGQIDALIRQILTGKNYETQFMLLLYINDLRVLLAYGYELPEGITEEDIDYIEDNYLNEQEDEYQ